MLTYFLAVRTVAWQRFICKFQKSGMWCTCFFIEEGSSLRTQVYIYICSYPDMNYLHYNQNAIILYNSISSDFKYQICQIGKSEYCNRWSSFFLFEINQIQHSRSPVSLQNRHIYRIRYHLISKIQRRIEREYNNSTTQLNITSQNLTGQLPTTLFWYNGFLTSISLQRSNHIIANYKKYCILLEQYEQHYLFIVIEFMHCLKVI